MAAVARGADAAAWIITDSTTGMVLEGSSQTKKLQVGSLTKIATAMVVIDWAAATHSDINQLAAVPQSAMGLGTQAGVGFTTGDKCSLKDLLYSALLQSDNSAAETLADHVGKAIDGSGVQGFVRQMNALARTQGMTRTRFVNPHGLDSEGGTAPYSTAEDLAKLTGYAMKNPEFRFYVSQKERRVTYTSVGGEESQYMLQNTNELLGPNGIDGVKTGQTKKAGGCVIISSAKAPLATPTATGSTVTPRRLNIVVLGSADRFGVGAGLLQRGWQLYDQWSAAGRPTKWKAPR